MTACTNFHALCERVSQRHLNGKPFFVLSDNDCFDIFNSYGDEDLGIQTGATEIKIR